MSVSAEELDTGRRGNVPKVTELGGVSTYVLFIHIYTYIYFNTPISLSLWRVDKKRRLGSHTLDLMPNFTSGVATGKLNLNLLTCKMGRVRRRVAVGL